MNGGRKTRMKGRMNGGSETGMEGGKRTKKKQKRKKRMKTGNWTALRKKKNNSVRIRCIYRT